MKNGINDGPPIDITTESTQPEPVNTIDALSQRILGLDSAFMAENARANKAESAYLSKQHECLELRTLLHKAYYLSEYAASSKRNNTEEFLEGEGGLFDLIEKFQRDCKQHGIAGR